MRAERLILCVVFATLLAACRGDDDAAYRVETLVAGSALHAPNGITFGPDGMLYAGSVSAQIVFRVDVPSGNVEVVVPAPAGEADDIAFAPDGTMVWTALLGGEIRALGVDGQIDILAADLTLINPIRFTVDGRMFAAQVGFDRLFEFPPDRTAKPRLVASKIGNLNSFEITADGQLYGPLSDSGTVARVDIDTGEVTPIAENVGKVVAVSMDSQGNVWTVDWMAGRLWRIDADRNGWRAPQLVATLEPPLDNLAIGPDDTVYVSRPAHSAIDRVDPETGEHGSLVSGSLAAPGGLEIINDGGREALLLADGYGYRVVDAQTGAVTAPYNLAQFGFPGAATDAAANAEVFALTGSATRPRVYLVDRASGKSAGSWTGFKAPYGILLRDNGDPIVADFTTGELVGLSRADRKLRTVIADQLDGPSDLAWAAPGAVYVAETGAGRILRIALTDGARSVVAHELAGPEGIAVLPDGRIVVVEVGAQRLVAIEPDDGTIEVLAAGLPVGDPRANSPAPVHLLSGIAIGADGSLYVSGDRDNSVLKLVLN